MVSTGEGGEPISFSSLSWWWGFPDGTNALKAKLTESVDLAITSQVSLRTSTNDVAVRLADAVASLIAQIAVSKLGRAHSTRQAWLQIGETVHTGASVTADRVHTDRTGAAVVQFV